MHPHRLSIIIPAYNEQATIQEILKKILEVDLDTHGVSKEIIIVNDGSTDDTVARIEEFKQKHPTLSLTLISQKNQGKGSAIRAAIPYCSGDIIIIQDADLEYDPQDYANLIFPILNNKAEVVYGSRRLNKRNVKYSGLSFYIGGLILTIVTNVLYNIRITDEPTCYKVFRADILKNIPLTCTRFEFCPEITAKISKRKIAIHEVPIAYYPRSIEQGKKINWGDGVEALWVLLKYRIFNDKMLSLLHTVLSYKFIRFLIAGGTSAVVHIGIVFVATHIFSVWYLLASIVGFLCAVGINFVMQKFFTFRDTQAKTVHIQSFLFFLVSSINLIVNTALMVFFVEYTGLKPVIAQILTSALIAIWSYLMYRRLFHVKPVLLAEQY